MSETFGSVPPRGALNRVVQHPEQGVPVRDHLFWLVREHDLPFERHQI